MYRKTLQCYWGYDDFRGIQRDIIESIDAGRDTLGLMPTGGGKSVTFQVPAMTKDGVCVVVTPLIALMKDQVLQLRRRGILAAYIHSGMTNDDVIKTLENCILGNMKFLYISPERISSPLFLKKFSHMRVCLITVDEAHCISQWGHDFRPSYLSITELRRLKPEIPILALTATATAEVVEDIQRCLGFRERNVIRMSFERKNLTYVVRKTSDKEGELVHILNSVPGSAVVYTRSRKGTRDVAQMLQDSGISATFYHAGLDHAKRSERQRQWIDGEVRVMVATNAFGMGIDKPDVRIVAHTDCPDTLEAYFQEAGRAGRDGRQAWAVLLYNQQDDIKLRRRIASNYPPKEVIWSVYEHLAYFFQVAMGFGGQTTHEFDLDRFCGVYRFFPATVESALRILQNAGYLEYETEPDSKARLMFLARRDDLYKINDLTKEEDNVITATLRIYGGLFSDSVMINETVIAQEAGLTEDDVYQALKSLARRGIVEFIPKRKTPFITYLKDRVDVGELKIPASIYEDRKDLMERQVASVIGYAGNDHECRSRQLLRYFGEEAAEDCGRCDVCIENRKNVVI